MLPTMTTPIHELPIPSTGKKIQVRPFLVKEEKLLLMALKSGDSRYIIDTTKQVIRNCIIDSDVNIDKLPFFDIDYLFIALRAKSVGESIDIKYTCNNVVDGNACGAVFPATIDITNCKVVKDDTISNEVLLPGQIKVKLKYPNYSQIKAILDDENVIDKKIKLVVASIDYIQEREKIISLKDTTPEELTTFVESLTQEQYHKLEHWIDNFPSFVITSEATCKKCGFKHQLEYNDFDAFFD